MRSTEPGLLAGVPGRAAPPDGARRKEGGFSLVVEPPRGRLRKLPALYVNDAQVYAGRDPAGVVAALGRAVDAFVHSGSRATYMLTPCEVGGRRGLYGSDFFNRSAYRRRLERLGMTFSGESFTVFHEDGTFGPAAGPRFRADFVTLGVPPPDGGGVTRSARGELLYQVVYYRIADIGEDEVARLASALEGVEGVSAADPAGLVAALTA